MPDPHGETRFAAGLAAVMVKRSVGPPALTRPGLSCGFTAETLPCPANAQLVPESTLKPSSVGLIVELQFGLDALSAKIDPRVVTVCPVTEMLSAPPGKFWLNVTWLSATELPGLRVAMPAPALVLVSLPANVESSTCSVAGVPERASLSIPPPAEPASLPLIRDSLTVRSPP